MSNSTVPIKEFRLELSDLTYTGHDLVRPESVLAQSNGTLWTSDGRGGVTRINPDGSQQFLGGLGGNEPNGLAMTDDGSLIVANLGLGKVQKLHPNGHVEDLLTEVDGVSITTPNFVFLDGRNRLWISVTTREHHWWPAAAAMGPYGCGRLTALKATPLSVGRGEEQSLDILRQHLRVEGVSWQFCATAPAGSGVWHSHPTVGW